MISISKKQLQSILYATGAICIVCGVALRCVYFLKEGWYFIGIGTILGSIANIIISMRIEIEDKRKKRKL